MRPRLCQADTSIPNFGIETSHMKKLRQLHVFSKAAVGVAGGSCRLSNRADGCCVIWGDLPGYVASKPDFSALPGNFFIFQLQLTYNIVPGICDLSIIL